MKNLLTIFTILLSITLYGQTTDVPSAVNEAFKAKYPDITKVQWTQSKDMLAATFIKGQKTQAYFKTDGEWVKTISILSEDDLLDEMTELIEADYEEYSVTDFLRIENSVGETIYQLNLVNEDDEKVKLKFTLEGTLIK